MPLISICIPTYNESKYIIQTLHWLSKQTVFPQCEIVIADYDPEGTKATYNTIAMGLRDKPEFQGLIKWVNVFKSGIGIARNIAAQSARGQIMVCFDADCSFAQPDGLEQLIAPLVNGSAVMTHCLNQIYPEDMKKWGDNANIQLTNEFYKARSIFHSAGLPFPYEPGLAMTKQAYDAVGGFRDVIWLEGPLLGFDTALKFGLDKIKHLDSLLIYVSGRRAAGSKVIVDLNYNHGYR